MPTPKRKTIFSDWIFRILLVSMLISGGFAEGIFESINKPIVAFNLSNPNHKMLLISGCITFLFIILMCVRMIMWAKKNKAGIFAQKS